MSRPELKIGWATHEAAKYACETWHYSKVLPAGKIVKVGVWEDGAFIGVVLFSRGATPNIGNPYNLQQTEVCELTRIALNSHKTPVSRIMMIALKFLKQKSSSLRLVVSYADPDQGHHGGVYQATNWIYSGRSKAQCELIINGKAVHKRSAFSKYGTSSPKMIMKKANVSAQYGSLKWKHTYLMPLDEAMRAQILPLSKPYPKRAGSIVVNASGVHPEEGGAEPTPALHSEQSKKVRNNAIRS